MQTTHQSSQEELVSDDVRVLVHKKPACLVEFQVTASKNLIQKARLEAAKAVNKEVVLPGFRKGKAPDAMIAKKYPYDVERKFHSCLADVAFLAAQKLAKVPVLNNNSKITFDLKKSDQESAELFFSFETEPSTPSVDATLFVARPVAKKEVGEKEVNEAIRQMAFFYAEWTEVLDRPIQEGDFIIIDLDTIDGQETKRVFDHVRFEVKPERMARWMQDLVLNAKSGDVLEGLSEPDETASEAEKKEFVPKKVRLHIRKVEAASLPAMDDDFAKKVGAPDVPSMHDLVKNILVRQVEDKAKEDLREQVNHFLVTTYSGFDVPASLVQAEFEHRYSQAKENPEFVEHLKKISSDEIAKIEARMKEEAENSLRLFFLSKQIVQDAKIPITHQEVNKQAVHYRRTNSMGVESGNSLSKEEFALALSMVFLGKAQDFILQSQKA